jgi:hypothetical protein
MQKLCLTASFVDPSAVVTIAAFKGMSRSRIREGSAEVRDQRWFRQAQL